ncbi:hypothetical protein [Candidatus Williamhamiltonella defendens]
MEQCHSVLAKQDRAQWILECDICRCFDDISHDWLLQNVPMNKAVLRKWLKAGYIAKRHKNSYIICSENKVLMSH